MSHSLRVFIEAYTKAHKERFGFIERIEEVIDVYANLSRIEREAICNGADFTLDYAGEVESVAL